MTELYEPQILSHDGLEKIDRLSVEIQAHARNFNFLARQHTNMSPGEKKDAIFLASMYQVDQMIEKVGLISQQR